MNEKRSQRWAGWTTAGSLLLLILLFVGSGLLPGKVLLPLDIVVQMWPPWQPPDQVVDVANPLLTDVVDYIFPVKTLVAEQVRAGTLPLWNPYVLGGYPLTYNTQAALWYPLSLAYYLLSPTTAVNVVIVLQMLLGGLFMLAYLRLLGLRRPSAWLGAVLFLFNGMMVVWLEWQVVHAAVIWLPLQLYCVERFARAHGRVQTRYALLAGVAFALPWLGGHWNWALYGSLTTAVYTLWRLLPDAQSAWRAAATRRARLVHTAAALRGAVLMLLTGIGLSLIQVLPAFVYLSQGHRRPFTFAESLSLGLKNRAVVAFLPDFFGNPAHWNWDGPTNYNETAFYLGIAPLFLVMLALVLRRDSQTRFWGLWGGLTLLWALGTPAYGMLYVLPVFDGLWPSRAITAVLVCAAVLAALGLDRLLDGAPHKRTLRVTLTAVAGTILLLTAGYLWFYRPDLAALRPELLWMGLSLALAAGLIWQTAVNRSRVWLWLLLVWVVVDLFQAGTGYNTAGDVADLYPPTATEAFLKQDPEPFRITTLPQGVAYPPNASLQLRLANLSGYEPAILQRWVDYLSAAEGQNAIYFERELMPLNGLDSPLIDALNVKYVVTTSDWYAEQSTPGASQEIVDQQLRLQPLDATAGSVQQRFSVPDAGLHRLSLPLDIAPDATGQVIVRVFAPDGGQEFANAAWDVTNTPPDGWADFYFGAFPSEWGRDFLFTAVHAGSGSVSVGAGPAGVAFRSYYLPRPQLANEDGKTRTYLNPGYFPRAYVVGQALAAADAGDALQKVLASADSLDRLVVIEGARDLPQSLLQESPPPDATISAFQSTLNRVRLTVRSDAPGMLVLADTYYPGWRATVDGTPTPVYRANSVVRAIYLPEGTHAVEFTFRPPDFIVAALVSLLTAVAMGGALLWTARRPA